MRHSLTFGIDLDGDKGAFYWTIAGMMGTKYQDRFVLPSDPAVEGEVPSLCNGNTRAASIYPPSALHACPKFWTLPTTFNRLLETSAGGGGQRLDIDDQISTYPAISGSLLHELSHMVSKNESK